MVDHATTSSTLKDFQLDCTFGYAVLQTSRMMTNSMNGHMAELGGDLTIEQGMVLYFIAEQETPEMIQQDLAQIMNKNKSAILRTIDQLEKKGYAKRTAVANDRRKNSLEITTEGKKVVENLKKVVAAKEKAMRSQFSEKEVNAFFKILETMRNLPFGKEMMK